MNRLQWQGAQVAAGGLGVTLQSLAARGADDFAAALAAAATDHADAFLILDCPLFGSEVIQQTLLNGRPAMYGYRGFVDAGGFMAYGPSVTEMLRRADAYVDKILKGAKPADLPVEQPMKFELVINLKTAQALGLTTPPTLLFQADEVIQ